MWIRSLVLVLFVIGREGSETVDQFPRTHDDHAPDHQVVSLLGKDVLEVEPHIKECLARNATSASYSWILKKDVRFLQSTNHGVVPASHVSRSPSWDGAHPIN